MKLVGCPIPTYLIAHLYPLTLVSCQALWAAVQGLSSLPNCVCGKRYSVIAGGIVSMGQKHSYVLFSTKCVSVQYLYDSCYFYFEAIIYHGQI